MDTIFFTYGRFNPPTVAHEELVRQLKFMAADYGGLAEVYLTKTEDSLRNPLPYALKLEVAREAFGGVVIDSPNNSIISVMRSFESRGVDKVVFVLGSDREETFSRLLDHYNGKEYFVPEIECVSIGTRDAESNSIEGVSASKARDCVVAGDYEGFSAYLPTSLSETWRNRIYETIQEKFARLNTKSCQEK